MSRQLLVYAFGPDANFEGRLVGALEGIESGGALRVLDALFVASDSETASGLPAEALRKLGETLDPGAAMLALLVEHAWSETLEDAVSRTGGTPRASQFVEATTLAELGPALTRVGCLCG
jgi:hypothetical protein